MWGMGVWQGEYGRRKSEMKMEMKSETTLEMK